MAGVCVATSASVVDVLHQLDGDFGPMAEAFANGSFSLWVGAGISRGAIDLGGIIKRALEFLRVGAHGEEHAENFKAAFYEAMALADIADEKATAVFDTELDDWPKDVRDQAVGVLWNKYSDLLDIRVPGQPQDFMLWTAVDVRDAFRDPPPPQCVHLCIAILVLEGALKFIASANWDGFIEEAFDTLSAGLDGNLQVVVDPDHLRDKPGKAKLLKFHGCIVHAQQDPDQYRKYLVASRSQITDWPNNNDFAPMRKEVEALAANSRALVTGLSLQDGNLQDIFSKAKNTNPWPWPCNPQGQVFCEAELRPGQKQMLKTVYGNSYSTASADIEGQSIIKAWGEQVLLAFVLRILATKFAQLVARVADGWPTNDKQAIRETIVELRDFVAGYAIGDRTAFLMSAVQFWAKLMGVFRAGLIPPDLSKYEIVSSGTAEHIQDDANVAAAGLGQFGVALALLFRGQTEGKWTIALPNDAEIESGLLQLTGSWTDAPTTQVYLCRDASVALKLSQQGIFANDNTVVIHADDAWQNLVSISGTGTARKKSRAPGRTGANAPRHVSIKHLVDHSTGFDHLSEQFTWGLAV